MKHILATLAFYASNPGLHSYSKTHRSTIKAVATLARRGYLTVYRDSHQARFTGKTFVN